MRIPFILLGALLSGLTSAAAQDVLVIRDVRLFDGARVHPSATVVVRGGVIEAVGPTVRMPPDAVVIEGAGHTLLPGFIDAHTHTLAAEDLEQALAFGVVVQLDMFTDPELAARWRREQESGSAVRRADVLSAGSVVTAPGGHGTQFGLPIPTLRDPADAAAFVAERVREGSAWIKIIVENGSVHGLEFPTLDTAALGAAIRAAHAHGRQAVVHVATLADARQAVRAGADGLVHIWLDSIPGDEFVREMRARGTFIVPTLTVSLSVTGEAGSAPLLEDERVRRLLSSQRLQQLGSAFPRHARSLASYAVARASIGRLARAGVPILAGTDAPNPGTTYGASLHRELELLVEAGLSPLEALRAATGAAAAAFGLSHLGRIAPGARANLVLVAGDPTADITATRAIAGVWKQGRRFDRDAFAADIERRVVARAAPVETGLLSDFEGGEPITRTGTSWIVTTDALFGGASTAELAVIEGGALGTARALLVTGVVHGGGPTSWAGALFFPAAPPMTPVDMSAASGFRFHARGDGRTYRVLLFTERSGQVPLAREFVAGPTWQEHTFAWRDFGQADGSDVTAIAIVAGPAAGPFAIVFDEFELR